MKKYLLTIPLLNGEIFNQQEINKLVEEGNTEEDAINAINEEGLDFTILEDDLYKHLGIAPGKNENEAYEFYRKNYKHKDYFLRSQINFIELSC